MPLLIEGSIISKLPKDIVEFVNSHISLKEASNELVVTPSREVGSRGLLYVGQREYAVVTCNTENIDIVGCDDATTCHILVVRHPASGVTAMGHFDGTDTLEGISCIVNKVKQLSHGGPEGRLEVHLAGGFKDSKFYSIALTRDILRGLMSMSDELHLLTASVTDLNDTIKDGLHFPVIYGLGVELKTGLIFPATFPDKGPDMNIRGAANFVCVDQMLDVFVDNCLIIGPFNWNVPRHLTSYYDASDSTIRQTLSTSPEQEPHHFVQHMRDSLLVLRDHPNPLKTLFPNGEARRYCMASSGTWTAVAS